MNSLLMRDRPRNNIDNYIGTDHGCRRQRANAGRLNPPGELTHHQLHRSNVISGNDLWGIELWGTKPTRM
jgi:hypothetical protein